MSKWEESKVFFFIGLTSSSVSPVWWSMYFTRRVLFTFIWSPDGVQHTSQGEEKAARWPSKRSNLPSVLSSKWDTNCALLPALVPLRDWSKHRQLSRHRPSLEITNKPTTKAKAAQMTSLCCMRSHKMNFLIPVKHFSAEAQMFHLSILSLHTSACFSDLKMTLNRAPSDGAAFPHTDMPLCLLITQHNWQILCRWEI